MRRARNFFILLLALAPAARAHALGAAGGDAKARLVRETILLVFHDPDTVEERRVTLLIVAEVEAEGEGACAYLVPVPAGGAIEPVEPSQLALFEAAAAYLDACEVPAFDVPAWGARAVEPPGKSFAPLPDALKEATDAMPSGGGVRTVRLAPEGGRATCAVRLTFPAELATLPVLAPGVETRLYVFHPRHLNVKDNRRGTAGRGLELVWQEPYYMGAYGHRWGAPERWGETNAASAEHRALAAELAPLAAFIGGTAPDGRHVLTLLRGRVRDAGPVVMFAHSPEPVLPGEDNPMALLWFALVLAAVVAVATIGLRRRARESD